MVHWSPICSFMPLLLSKERSPGKEFATSPWMDHITPPPPPQNFFPLGSELKICFRKPEPQINVKSIPQVTPGANCRHN